MISHDYIRSLCVPENLPGGRLFFQPICRALSLVYIEYETAILRDWSRGGELGLNELFDTHPELMVMPTFPPIEENMLDFAANRVQAWASVSTGTDHVDLARLGNDGMHFFHAPGANAVSVAEYVLCALSELFPDERLLAGDVVCGIVGYGRIGSLLSGYLERLEIPFRAYDPFVSGTAALEDVLTADVITFHVPLTRDGEHPTFEMVDETYISKISPGSALINTARGPIFTPASFDTACENLRCVMDVFPGEPPSAEQVAKPFLVSPHVAGYSHSARVGGVRATALAFAAHRGLDPDIVPEIPKTDYELYGLNFLAEESRALKSKPDSFAGRRANYPPRGDLGASLVEYRRGGARSITSAFHRRLLERVASIPS